MKTVFYHLAIIFVVAFFPKEVYTQGVIISSDEMATPDPSAMLDVQSTDKGFLPPRMTTIERNSIVTPAEGLVVYDTDEESLFLYSSGVWERLAKGTGSHWLLNGSDIYYNDGRVGIGTDAPQYPLHLLGGLGTSWQVERFSGAQLRGTANISEASVGTHNATGFRLLTNNTVRMHITPDGKVGVGTTNPSARLHLVGDLRIQDGSHGAGKVLTSDVFGNASWSDLDLYGNNTFTVDTSGNGNFTTISAALNSVTPTAENPVTILVKPGIYFETVELKSHVTLMGSDAVNVLITGWPGGTPGFGGDPYGMLLNSVTNVQIKNLTIRSNSPSDPYLYYGVLMINSDARFENVNVMGDYNFEYPMNNGLKVENAVVEFIGGSILEVADKAIQLLNSNAVLSNTKLSAAFASAVVENGSHLELANSHVEGGGDGVTIQSGSAAHLTGNRFMDNWNGVRNEGKLLMSGNHIRSSTSAGVKNFSNATITGNYFIDCAIQAVFDESGGKSTITGNHIENSSFSGEPAMTILNSDATVSSNVFNNNAHGDIASGTSSGVPWLVGNRGSVIGNPIRGIMAGIDNMQIEREGDNMLINLPATGNIGIGTATPENPLVVRWTNNATPGVSLISPSSGGPVMDWYGWGPTHRLRLEYQTPYYDFSTDGVDRHITFNPSGNVGIGTTSPNSLLHISNGTQDLEISPNIIKSADGDLMTFTSEGNFLLESKNALNVDASNTFQVGAGSNAEMNAGFDVLLSAGNRIRLNNLLNVLGSSAVGINTTNTSGFLLAVNGSAAKPGGGSWAVFSDSRLKHHIKPIKTGMLDRLLKLRGYTFEYEPEAIENRLALPGRQTGLIAQEVQEVFPDWVESDADGYLYVTERGLTAIIVEALRELREEKDAEIGKLQSENEELASRLESVENLVYSLVDEMTGGAPGRRDDVVQSGLLNLPAGISEDKSGE
jgi:hypothetical protein